MLSFRTQGNRFPCTVPDKTLQGMNNFCEICDVY